MKEKIEKHMGDIMVLPAHTSAVTAVLLLRQKLQRAKKQESKERILLDLRKAEAHLEKVRPRN